LEKVLGVPANFWLERERQFRRELTEVYKEKAKSKQKDWG